ncbi:MAG: hypothetical protein WCF78_02035 [archaeon]
MPALKRKIEKKGFKIKTPEELNNLKRLTEPNLHSFNKINNETISERNQEIKIHLQKLGKKGNINPEDKQKIKYLIDLAQNPVLSDVKEIERSHNFNKKTESLNVGIELIKEKKKLIEILDEIDKYNEIKQETETINRKLTEKKEELNKISNFAHKNYEYRMFLNRYKRIFDLEKTNKLIERLAKDKKTQTIPYHDLENKILVLANEIQNTFPKLKIRDTTIIVEDAKQNILLKERRIKEIINNHKYGLNLGNSEIVRRSLNSIKLQLIENIRKKTESLISESQITRKKERELIESYDFEKNKLRLRVLAENQRNIYTRLPTIENHTKEELNQRIEEITKKISPERKENIRFGNPLKEHIELTNLETYKTNRNKAIILAKIERELSKLVKKYN